MPRGQNDPHRCAGDFIDASSTASAARGLDRLSPGYCRPPKTTARRIERLRAVLVAALQRRGRKSEQSCVQSGRSAGGGPQRPKRVRVGSQDREAREPIPWDQRGPKRLPRLLPRWEALDDCRRPRGASHAGRRRRARIVWSLSRGIAETAGRSVHARRRGVEPERRPCCSVKPRGGDRVGRSDRRAGHHALPTSRPIHRHRAGSRSRLSDRD
jgi:hypothetical protein